MNEKKSANKRYDRSTLYKSNFTVGYKVQRRGFGFQELMSVFVGISQLNICFFPQGESCDEYCLYSSFIAFLELSSQ
jgi:hypothetical protein